MGAGLHVRLSRVQALPHSLLQSHRVTLPQPRALAHALGLARFTLNLDQRGGPGLTVALADSGPIQLMLTQLEGQPIWK